MTTMAITTGSAHLPALGEHQRQEIGNELQAELIELIDLSLLGKQLHWSVVGPNFRPLHLQLDELIDSWRDSGDVVAERAVVLGFFPEGQAAAVASDSPIESVERGPIEDHAVIQKLASRLAGVAERTRERMDRLAELDSASEDVLVGVIRSLEEQLWMIRAQLPQGH
jgi:starvation-inducible DNA-binding protein